VRERLGAPCDTGTPAMSLFAKWPHLRKWEGADSLPEVWWSNATECGLQQRVDALARLLAARPETTIAVVGHGGLFRRLLGARLSNCSHMWVEHNIS
jgi:broad specificity phosphatase PhoE